ncbi:hypothetical protein GF367_05020 [Candidatus Woesearchaeota archaeon]|nr:hypothetical protein [Candidatus Woesearchaeota archaeon]
MHEPDQEPDAKIVKNKRFVAQWTATLSLFIGLGLTIIGAVLSMLSNKFGFFLFVIPGLAASIVAMELSRNVPDKRAHSTAVLSLVLHVVFFFVLLIIFLFFKEAGSAL